MAEIGGYIITLIKNNWAILIPITLSLVAIIFTAFKDFILPWFVKPKLQITYEKGEPYKRQANINAGQNQLVVGFFDRFKIKNVGSETAKNCRCQIYSIINEKGKELHLQGFPIKWASRPESAIDFIKAERLNLAPGESEFVDLTNTRIDNVGYFYFQPYHNVPIGMDGQVTLKDYTLKIIISGDNFKPYFATFEIDGHPKEKHILEIILKEVSRK
ncbi:MAG: hypothetical protein UR15_C0001G0015 [Parcubacteria group bacterium GW2011_GWA2_31_28]|nr:MAG: hypothetical protein UR15_C0001G0015 [Parcubacteria group bacterium GW2011_GWA2_31_28]